MRLSKDFEATVKIDEQMDHVRGRAATLGEIARIEAARGQVDQAYRLHEERLRVYEGLGDVRERTHTSWSIAKLELEKPKPELSRIIEHLGTAYRLLIESEHLDRDAAVGLDWGQVLAAGGQTDEARAVLTCSRDGFRQLGPAEAARRAETLLEQIKRGVG